MLELDLWHLADVDFETKHVREKRTSLVRLQTVNHPRGRPAIDRPARVARSTTRSFLGTVC
jgi:hypothetical protein